jgi:hypothetical protein
MERNARRTQPAVILRALVPLTSRDREDRYWYDPGHRGAGWLAGSADGAYGFDPVDPDEDGRNSAWICVGLGTGH